MLVIETDDQTVAELAAMPRTRALIAARGVSFDRSIVSLSQCCPSRATLLTGRYAHNHGVRSALPPSGGFDAFDDAESLAVWLRRSGYATALVGKYLNGYGRADPRQVPPGWTEWHGLLGPTAYRFLGFAMNHDGATRWHAEGYQTDVLTAIAEDVIRRRARRDAPFFLWTTYVAPHIGAPRGLLDDLPGDSAVMPPALLGAGLGAPPVTPDFNEADVTDKPLAIRRRSRLGRRAKWVLAARRRERQASLLAVDAGVARLVRALRAADELERTVIVFTSDNGFLSGEHRVRAGKVAPYEPAIRVPLLIRGPGVPAGERRSRLVWNGDLAPTILAAAGARPPWEMDGRSLWPLLRGRPGPGRRAVLLEGPPAPWSNGRPRFTGLRTERYAYIEHAGGEVELYDLAEDPFELENRAGRPEAADVQTALARRLEALRYCAGRACRAAPSRG